ncbi:hypothetical protein EYF80_064217 [Liparis tanakae]|uniref:Uncharacterized protein n=1 Tax=Liparis tanakae TaxID=230148 RepID=A0A4Z2EA76_9TELE|nr:hypothetical protein EYF80_064217 [Liparis tanakae]
MNPSALMEAGRVCNYIHVLQRPRPAPSLGLRPKGSSQELHPTYRTLVELLGHRVVARPGLQGPGLQGPGLQGPGL